MEPNYNLFDKWDEQSAYILGFWLSDGSIYLAHMSSRPKYCHKIFNICNTDKQIMDDISKILQHSYYAVKPRTLSRKMSYTMKCYSDKLFDFCYNITRTTDKSHSNFSLPNIPKELFHHFIRGFFDGDGSIFYTHYKNRHGKTLCVLKTSFTGGKETDHIEQLRDWLRDNVGLGNLKVRGSVHKKLSYSQYDSMLLCNFMYKDATIYMKRKKDIWDAADKQKLMNSTKYFSNKV